MFDQSYDLNIVRSYHGTLNAVLSCVSDMSGRHVEFEALTMDKMFNFYWVGLKMFEKMNKNRFVLTT